MENTTNKIAAACTACGKQYRLSSAAVGKTAKCGCGNRFVVTVAKPDEVQVPTPRCAAHPDQAAVGQCVQCAARVCSDCALRTKSGRLACRACVTKHRARQGAANPTRLEIPLAELSPTTGSATPGSVHSVHSERDDQVPLAEIVDDEEEVVGGIPAQPRSASPGTSPFDDLPYTVNATASVFPSAGAQPFVAPSNVSGGARTGTDSVAVGGNAAGGRCPQHPAAAVAHHCSICHKAVCRTCTFAFAPNMICCPECASETSTPLSLHRQVMVYGSLVCAILASLAAALLFSGLFVFMDTVPFGGLMLEALIVLPLCVGIGMAFGSYNRAEGNPAMLWVGGIWNGLGLIAWMLFIGIVTLSGF